MKTQPVDGFIEYYRIQKRLFMEYPPHCLIEDTKIVNGSHIAPVTEIAEQKEEAKMQQDDYK